MNFLLSHLEDEVFHGSLVPDGIQRIDKWPDRAATHESRKAKLLAQIKLRLTDIEGIGSVRETVDTMIENGDWIRVVYVEIKGPCTRDDGELIREMLEFWRELVEDFLGRKKPHLSLPALIVGHIDPDEGEGAAATIDTTSFYHGTALPPEDRRRLNLIRGADLRRWITTVLKSNGEDYADLEQEIVDALGERSSENVEVRLARIYRIVDARAA
jgi:hypothetical protein